MNGQVLVAAMKTASGEYIIGVGPQRHGDLIRRMKRLGYSPETIAMTDQGFWTSDGQYLTRKEARLVVLASGQLDETMHGSELFTEDLW